MHKLKNFLYSNCHSNYVIDEYGIGVEPSSSAVVEYQSGVV